MNTPFHGFDWSNFWSDSDYSVKKYREAPLADDVLVRVEERLGVMLPRAYVAMCRLHNGGIVLRTAHASPSRTSWSSDHVAIHGVFAIGDQKPHSLCGELGSHFWPYEWGYPPIGVYFADCPSAGHDMLCLDYRECGPRGEPTVVHVDQDWDYQITPIAPNFESFIRGLVKIQAYESDGA